MLHQKHGEPSERAHDPRRISRRDALLRFAVVPAAAALATFLPTGSSAAAFDLGDLPIPIPGAGGGGSLPQLPGTGGNGSLPQIQLPPGVHIPETHFGGKNGQGGVTINERGVTLPTGQELPLPQLDTPVPLYGEVLPGTLYRSSQPSDAGFAWLKANGIKTIVDLRDEFDDGPSIAPLGFGKYVYIPIVDNTPPTNKQAEQFLGLVTDRGTWPILVHAPGDHPIPA